MKRLIKDNQASAIPLIIFIFTIIASGALYTFFFLQFGLPQFDSYVPNSDSKTYIMMVFYAMPLFVLIIGVVALLKSGLKRGV